MRNISRLEWVKPGVGGADNGSDTRRVIWGYLIGVGATIGVAMEGVEGVEGDDGC